MSITTYIERLERAGWQYIETAICESDALAIASEHPEGAVRIVAVPALGGHEYDIYVRVEGLAR